MEDLRPLILEQISKIAEEKINRLDEIWARLFDQEIRQRHMKALLDHADRFYSDIVRETEEREKLIQARIDALMHEERNLEPILEGAGGDPVEAELPLYAKQVNLEKRLKVLRETARDLLLTKKVKLSEQLEMSHDSAPLNWLTLKSQIRQLKLEVEVLTNTKCDRDNRIEVLGWEIRGLFLQLTGHYDYPALANTKPTLDNIESLESHRDDLNDTFETLKRRIKTARDYLKSLYLGLNLNVTDDTLSFLKYILETDALSASLYDRLISEIHSLEKEHATELAQSRKKVRDLMSNWTVQSSTVAKLDINQLEFRDFEDFCAVNKNIFNLMEKRQSFWNRIKTLQQSEGDPKKFQNRGGKLLKEELERKSIAKQLPQIEEQLAQMIQQFELKTNRNFSLFGEKLQDINERDYEVIRKLMTPTHPISARSLPTPKKYQHIFDVSKRFNPLRY